MEAMVRFAGFFRQLEPDGPVVFSEDIQAAVVAGPNYPVEGVVRYLKAGHPILDVADSARDVLGGASRIAGSSSVLTDGEWVWRWDLTYYVERYNVALPELFVEHMRKRLYQVPTASREELVAISYLVNDALGFKPSTGSGPSRQRGE
ncbi:hypothetical protein [Streptomyces sp. NPDC059015]|uniref:hypothetical protein n=1 Tax=unclassified Streptomyces TaxID=2593676 RepID=UPI00367E40CE